MSASVSARASGAARQSDNRALREFCKRRSLVVSPRQVTVRLATAWSGAAHRIRQSVALPGSAMRPAATEMYLRFGLSTRMSARRSLVFIVHMPSVRKYACIMTILPCGPRVARGLLLTGRPVDVHARGFGRMRSWHWVVGGACCCRPFCWGYPGGTSLAPSCTRADVGKDDVEGVFDGARPGLSC
jgi:hypothetical protein